ncbi:MAG TPA: cellulase family glycosylhydrolase [Nitrososphaeraceae archaeon]
MTKNILNNVLIVSLLTAIISVSSVISNAQLAEVNNQEPINGVAMKGAYVSVKQNNYDVPSPPPNYIDNSFKLISEAGLNHVRFLIYWEAYEMNPEAFMNEIRSVADAGDKWGVKIIYDNHQWHTASWLERKGTGFPNSIFANNSKYVKGGGGNTPDPTAKLFWSDWWNRSVKDAQGRDGWTQMADFLKKIVTEVDNRSSTLGYEILSEPHVNNVNEWPKLGEFNTFIVGQLRNVTQKTIAYSMNVPIDLKSPISITPENLAKMAPSDKQNVVFKISVYGVPDRDAYQKQRFDTFLKTRDLTGIPIYIGEWNNVVRTPGEGGVFKLNPALSDLTEDNAEQILQAFKEAGVWGTAYWKWDYRAADTASFNLVLNNNGTLVPTKYYDILKNAVAAVYGNSSNSTSAS